MYAQILVPLDGSKLAERAHPAAEEMAQLMSASLHLLRVVDPTQVDLQIHPIHIHGGPFHIAETDGNPAPVDGQW